MFFFYQSREKYPQYLTLLKLTHDQSENIYLIFKFKIGEKGIYMHILHTETFGRIYTKMLTVTRSVILRFQEIRFFFWFLQIFFSIVNTYVLGNQKRNNSNQYPGTLINAF